MSAQAPPAAPVLPPVPIRGTIADAWRLMRRYPRLILLPMFAVQVPVAAVSASVTLVLYFTVFSGEPVKAASDLINAGPSGPLFAFLAVSAFEGLFAQVARGATILGTAAALRDRPEPLPNLLDPAFTRLGGLLILAIAPLLLFLGLAATIVGLVLVPYLVLRLGLVMEAYLLDGVTPAGAFRRSWTVLSGSLWRFFLTLLLAITALIVPLFVMSSFSLLIAGGRTTQLLATAAVTLIQGVLVVPMLAFFTAVTTLFYLRVKERHDARLAARN